MSSSSSDLSLIHSAITSFIGSFAEGIDTAFTLGPEASLRVRSYAEAFGDINWRACDWNPSVVARLNQTLEEEIEAEEALENLEPAVDIGSMFNRWPEQSPQLIVALDVVHQLPWQDFQRLLPAIANRLASAGVFILIGPVKRHGGFNSAREMEWDASLRRMNSQLGLRDLQEILQAAEGCRIGCLHESYIGQNRQGIVFRRVT